MSGQSREITIVFMDGHLSDNHLGDYHLSTADICPKICCIWLQVELLPVVVFLDLSYDA